MPGEDVLANEGQRVLAGHTSIITTRLSARQRKTLQMSSHKWNLLKRQRKLPQCVKAQRSQLCFNRKKEREKTHRHMKKQTPLGLQRVPEEHENQLHSGNTVCVESQGCDKTGREREWM